MRPIQICFQCFGPYMQEQKIDFTQFEENGLFLICGETGAGKTTILDAICYALYGRSSGGLRGDLEVMRCKLADKQDETRVEYIFEVNGERYCFIRSLKYGRKNLNDFHNCMIYRDGVYVPIFENPKATAVNQKAQELIGLTYDQFRQVVMLPQGQFEKLLVSDSAEKEKILVKLFHADRWQTVAEEIGRRVNARDHALKLQYQQMMAQLGNYGCGTLEMLEERITAETQTMAECEEALQKAQQTHIRQKQAYELAVQDNQLFSQQKEAKDALQALLEKQLFYREEAVCLEAAATAQTIASEYAAYQTAKAAVSKAEQQLQDAGKVQIFAAQALQKAQSALAQQEEKQEANDQDKKRLILLEDAKTVYEGLESKKSAMQAAKNNYLEAQQSERRTKKALLQAESGLQHAVNCQHEAMEYYSRIQRGYLQSIGVTLAQGLITGQPCPVCGSTEHPSPAIASGEVVSQGQVDAAQASMERENGAVKKAMSLREEKANTQQAASQNARSLEQAWLLAQAEYTNVLNRRITGIETSEQLNKAISSLQSGISAFEETLKNRKDALQKANNHLQQAAATEGNCRTAVEEGRKGLAQAQQMWQESLTHCGMTEEAFLQANLEPRVFQKRSAVLAKYRADLESAEHVLQQKQAAVNGREAPDMPAVQAAFAHAQTELQDLHTRHALARKALDTMQKDRDALAASLEAYHTERAKVDADLEFSNRLRGTNGLSLQRYVLGVMLTSITVAANRLLQDVYGGRYQLYRTNEIAGSGRKSGLELEVYDAAHAQRRSVITLSGGEKFLVALSLALGLSTVVQAQGGGVRLDAMFVDEGFGSLDTQAVNDALEVLQSIRSSGVVGIISHVDQLAETIPAKIQVNKGKNGSTCHCIF